MKRRFLKFFLFILLVSVFFYIIILADLSPDMNSYRTAYGGHPTTTLHEFKAHLSNNTDNLLWFVHITDTHIGAYRLKGNSRQNLRDFLENMEYINPSFIINTGDLVNGRIPIPFEQDVEQWRDYYNILAAYDKINTSLYYDIVGNHDGYGNSLTFSYYLNWSVQKTLQYTWNRTLPSGNGNYTFIALNSAQDSGSYFPDGTSGNLNQTELDWFEAQLIAAQSSNMTIVFAHHPENDVANYTTTTSKKTFLDLIEDYNVSAYIFGHGHENIKRNQGGTICIETDSIGVSSNVAGYRIFALDNDGISSKYQPLNTWPAVLITCPIDRDLTMQAFDIPTDMTAVSIRALVFDEKEVLNVDFKIDDTSWFPMNSVPNNQYLWNASFDASILTEAEHTIIVRANSSSGISTDSVLIRVGSPNQPEIVNGPIPNFIKIKNSVPWILNLTMYEWDKKDMGIQLNWSIADVDTSLCSVVVTDILNDIVTFTPIKDATGTDNINFTLINSDGKQISQIVTIILVDRLDSAKFQLYLGIILAISVVGVVIINFLSIKRS
ncbi:MAG: metallophosphoesterase family protein [Promethearchaeota archaeon]